MHSTARAFVERAEDQYGFVADVHEFPAGTKTAADAADAIGCDAARIASSLVFSASRPVVVVASGTNRVSEAKLAAACGVNESGVGMADPETVREVAGWSVGGVPPFCHDTDLAVLVDETLTQFETVWAAAGTPAAVFPVAPDRLREFADARVVDVAE